MLLGGCAALRVHPEPPGSSGVKRVVTAHLCKGLVARSSRPCLTAAASPSACGCRKQQHETTIKHQGVKAVVTVHLCCCFTFGVRLQKTTTRDND